jgi:hypothetical protein
MAQRLHDERVFEVPRGVLHAALADPAYQRARAAFLGTREVRCERRDGPEGIELTLHEARDTGYRGELFRTCMTMRWTADGARCRWTLRQIGGPGDNRTRADGETRLARLEPRRTRFHLEGRLAVEVPVLGPWIERVAVVALRRAQRREAAFLRRWLADMA